MKNCTLFTIILFLTFHYTTDNTWAKANLKPVAAESHTIKTQKKEKTAVYNSVNVNKNSLSTSNNYSRLTGTHVDASIKSLFAAEKNKKTPDRSRDKPDKKDSPKAKWSVISILSFVLGLLAALAFLIIFASPLAAWITATALAIAGLTLGIVGLVRKRERIKRGKGFAITGLVLSSLAIIGAITTLIVISINSLSVCNSGTDSGSSGPCCDTSGCNNSCDGCGSSDCGGSSCGGSSSSGSSGGCC